MVEGQARLIPTPPQSAAAPSLSSHKDTKPRRGQRNPEPRLPPPPLTPALWLRHAFGSAGAGSGIGGGCATPEALHTLAPRQRKWVHAEISEGRRGAEGACQPTDVCERFALGFATATSLPIRHAELVSASMLRPALGALAVKLTLEQVQGDKWAAACAAGRWLPKVHPNRS